MRSMSRYTGGFQSTPPVKAATSAPEDWQTKLEISIHAAREGGDKPPYHTDQNTKISIHAAREGGDSGNE